MFLILLVMILNSIMYSQTHYISCYSDSLPDIVLTDLDSTIINSDTMQIDSGMVTFHLNVLTHDTSMRDEIYKAIDYVNSKYFYVSVEFIIDTIYYFNFPIAKELTTNGYEDYMLLSDSIDMKNKLSMWIVPNDSNFCKITETMISCNRTGGWAFVGGHLTNNFVVTGFDISNHCIVWHEINHFFGLDHTFKKRCTPEEEKDPNKCHECGDKICDTPYDPNITALVKYGSCEVLGYNTIVNNPQSYYSPCYMKDYYLTLGQWRVIRHYAVNRHLSDFGVFNEF